jgi:quercetin dioxygenase-like cupin family protein
VALLDVMEPCSLEAGYAAPYCSMQGGARSAIFHPDGYSLWLVSAQLEQGAELAWEAAHGDEGVFVLSGAVEAGGTRCEAGGVVVVEAAVPAVVRAGSAAALLHFGPVATEPPGDGLFGPPAQGGRGVHVVDRAAARHVRYEGHPIDNHYYVDCTCPTCRIVLFTVAAGVPHTAASHLHSQDEIIHVLDGELQVGPQTVRAGMSVAIPAERRYGFRTPGPYRFINYRRDASTFTGAPGTEPVVETTMG